MCVHFIRSSTSSAELEHDHQCLFVLQKPKRRVRAPVSYGGGRSAAPTDKSQRARSMSFSPDRVRVRGRSPAFNALASTFEKNTNRNLSTPPPVVNKLYPKSDGAPKQMAFVRKNNQSLAIQEEAKEGDVDEEEDEEGLLIFSYDRLKTDSVDPATEIDITKREVSKQLNKEATNYSYSITYWI